MRRPALPVTASIAAALAACVLAAPASAATSRIVIRGAGFGHGVGMSQYGALGLAQRGWDYRQILAHYYTDTAVEPMPAPATVRVLLKSASSMTFSGASAAGSIVLDPSVTYRIAPSGLDRVAITDPAGRVLTVADPPVQVTAAGAPMLLGGKAQNGVTGGRYRGAFEFRLTALGDLRAINVLDTEDYVRGVVGGEIPPSWPAAVLQAQAVAARTYGITATKGDAKSGFTQYADTRSQVYLGVRGEVPVVDAAVQATARQVVTYDGIPAVTYFFSTSGGRTENVENGFPGAQPAPWLVSVRDPYDKISPTHAWGPVEMSLDTATSRLGSLVKGTLRNVRVVSRGKSQRVLRADVIGTGGTTRVSGDQIASRLGLMSTWMTFRVYNAAGNLVKAPKGSVTGTVPSTTTTTTPVVTTTTPATTTTTVPALPGGGAATPGATTDPSGGSISP